MVVNFYFRNGKYAAIAIFLIGEWVSSGARYFDKNQDIIARVTQLPPKENGDI